MYNRWVFFFSLQFFIIYFKGVFYKLQKGEIIMTQFFVEKTKGDIIIAEWEDIDWKQFRKTVHELRKQGYRKSYQDCSFSGHNYHEYYRRKGKKDIVAVTMMYV